MLSRKFLLAVFVIVLATILLIVDKINAQIWFSAISISSASYLGVNILNDFGRRYIKVKKK